MNGTHLTLDPEGCVGFAKLAERERDEVLRRGKGGFWRGGSVLAQSVSVGKAYRWDSKPAVMGLKYQAAECGLGAPGSNCRSMCGKEEMISGWQKDECVWVIKWIKTKKLKSSGRRTYLWYGAIGELRSHTQYPQLREEPLLQLLDFRYNGAKGKRWRNRCKRKAPQHVG